MYIESPMPWSAEVGESAMSFFQRESRGMIISCASPSPILLLSVFSLRVCLKSYL